MRASRRARRKLFNDALELLRPGDAVDRCEALIGLGDAQRQTGIPAYRETLLEASAIASDLKDADLAARAALANNRGWVSRFGAVDQERVAAIERALELDDPPQPARRARLLSLLAVELAHAPEHARRRALADEAVAIARRAGEPRTLAAALASSCYATWAPDTLARRARAGSRAERDGRGDAGSAPRVHCQVAGGDDRRSSCVSSRGPSRRSSVCRRSPSGRGSRHSDGTRAS